MIRYGYMDRVDFEDELGEALGGTKVYPSVEDLIEECLPHNVHYCGIVKVKIELIEVVEKGTNSWSK